MIRHFSSVVFTGLFVLLAYLPSSLLTASPAWGVEEPKPPSFFYEFVNLESLASTPRNQINSGTVIVGTSWTDILASLNETVRQEAWQKRFARSFSSGGKFAEMNRMEVEGINYYFPVYVQIKQADFAMGEEWLEKVTEAALIRASSTRFHVAQIMFDRYDSLESNRIDLKLREASVYANSINRAISRLHSTYGVEIEVLVVNDRELASALVTAGINSPTLHKMHVLPVQKESICEAYLSHANRANPFGHSDPKH